MTSLERSVERTGAAITVVYPITWPRADAWRHLLSNPPTGVKQPLRQSHRQLWAKAHTAEAWRWCFNPPPENIR